MEFVELLFVIVYKIMYRIIVQENYFCSNRCHGISDSNLVRALLLLLFY